MSIIEPPESVEQVAKCSGLTERAKQKILGRHALRWCRDASQSDEKGPAPSLVPSTAVPRNARDDRADAFVCGAQTGPRLV